MTDEEFDAIRARLASATPGPWEQGEPSGVAVWAGDTFICDSTLLRNAALIAHAPADIANLLAEVERLRVTDHRRTEAQRLYTTILAARDCAYQITSLTHPDPLEAAREACERLDQAARLCLKLHPGVDNRG